MQTKSERNRIIASHMASPQGRNILAASMVQPLREMRDYQGILRKVVMVDDLADGAEAYYDKDVNTPAFVISEQGQDVLAVQNPDRMYVPRFVISSNPMIPITQINQR